MNVRASYTTVRTSGEIVFIVDNDGPMSVTNDAEAVVAFVNAEHPGKRIVYRDTTGQWDELLHTNGRFDGFAPFNGK
jgi:hypothetical protein